MGVLFLEYLTIFLIRYCVAEILPDANQRYNRKAGSEVRANVEFGRKFLDTYRSETPEGIVDEIYKIASELKGVRIAHINATANGGGVAELLSSIIPLYKSLGIDADWLVFEGYDRFYDVTKRLHNALQGANVRFTTADWDLYLECNRENVASLSTHYDLIFVHDPQPAAIRDLVGANGTKWVWRSHIDTSEPNLEAWRTLAGFLTGYDAAVFSMSDFVAPDLPIGSVHIIPPAIDPHTSKNRPISRAKAEGIVAEYGLDTNRPFVSQISRFDPWKDPIGVLNCFKIVKESHPQLQLALLGNFADDDPEGYAIYQDVVEAASGVKDVHVITGLTDLVGAFQSLSRVVIQKSLREGFGLTVTEALWKGTPVVAGNVGGIRLQILDGVGGFLVNTVDECAGMIDYLLTHEEERRTLGEAGKEHVRKNFLIPRLLRDELALAKSLLNGNGSHP